MSKGGGDGRLAGKMKTNSHPWNCFPGSCGYYLNRPALQIRHLRCHLRIADPKNSYFLRGMRLAVTPDGEETPKELTLALAEDVTMEFVYIPPGKFIMGGDRAVISEDRVALADTPKHEVTLTRGFYLGKYEVTQAQYAAIMGKEQGASAKGPNHPVDGVKPSRALLLCDELTAKTGLEVRVPTEAEWEYTFEVPKAGDYTLSARVVTANADQSFQLAVNGSNSTINVTLPFTLGRWEESRPVTLTLKEGANTLHFWRDQAPQYGVAVKSFTLKPAGGK